MLRFAAAALLLAGCSPGVSPVQPRPKPLLQVTPERVDFGRVLGAKSRQLTVRNVGDPGAELVLQPVAFSSPDFTVSDTLLVTATAASAGFKTAELVVESNGGTVRVPLSADVSTTDGCEFLVSPMWLDFGLVTGLMQLSVTVRTTRSAACRIVDVALQGSDVFALAPGQLPLEVLPGEEKALRVQATPRQYGNQTGTLRIGAFTVELHATVATGCLTIIPGDFDFGTVKKGCRSAPRTFSIYNTCSVPVLPVERRLVGSSDFVVRGTLPELLASGGSPALLFIEYVPSDVGPDTAAVVLEVTHLGVRTEYVITVRGTAAAAPRTTDTWQFDRRATGDLLFVVDDSPSMAARQPSVAQNINRLVDYYLLSGVGLRVGLTTSSGDGGLLGPVITDATPLARVALAQQLSLIGSAGIEDPPLLAVAAAAAPSFSRDGGAPMGIITVSDSDDSSPGPVSTYLAKLTAMRPVPAYSAVGPQRDGGQPRARLAVSALTGSVEDIDFQYWFATFTPLTHGEWTQEVFFLSAMPIAASLQVTVDGVDVARGPWSYDGVSNAIVFQPGWLAPGSTVSVSYDTGCF